MTKTGKSVVFLAYVITEFDIGDDVLVWRVTGTIAGREVPATFAGRSYSDFDAAKKAILKHTGDMRD